MNKESIERVVEFINSNDCPATIAGLYALQASMDQGDVSKLNIEGLLDFLQEAGASFDYQEALVVALVARIPEEIIKQASQLAYEEDMDQVVGQIQGKWTIRAFEDPEADTLKNSMVVDAAGIKE